MPAVAIVRQFQNLLDVTYGTPANRDVPVFNSSTSKLVMRALTYADVSYAGGSVSATSRVLSISQTWNGSGVVFDGAAILNVTNTASHVSSTIFQIQVDGVSKFHQFIGGSISCPGSASLSERFGGFSAATGTNSLAVGFSASATTGDCIAIGYNSLTSGVYSIGIGTSSVTSGNSSVGIGEQVTMSAACGVAIGFQSNISGTETSSVAVGYQATAPGNPTGGGEAVAIGAFANASCWRGTAVGYKARASLVSSTAIGRGAWAEKSHDIAIGRGSWTDPTWSSICIGDANTSEVYFGSGHASTYLTKVDLDLVSYDPAVGWVKIHGHDGYDATASPSVFNINGGPLYLCGGMPTGTGTPGSVILQSADTGASSNNTKQTLRDRVSVVADGNIGFNATSFGSGKKVLCLGNAGTLPSGTPTGGGILYVDSGALKWKGSSGTVTTLGVA